MVAAVLTAVLVYLWGVLVKGWPTLPGLSVALRKGVSIPLWVLVIGAVLLLALLVDWSRRVIGGLRTVGATVDPPPQLSAQGSAAPASAATAPVLMTYTSVQMATPTPTPPSVPIRKPDPEDPLQAHQRLSADCRRVFRTLVEASEKTRWVTGQTLSVKSGDRSALFTKVTLRELEQEGLVEKREIPATGVTYRLTEAGEARAVALRIPG